jgi:hypothetical protein
MTPSRQVSIKIIYAVDDTIGRRSDERGTVSLDAHPFKGALAKLRVASCLLSGQISIRHRQEFLRKKSLLSALKSLTSKIEMQLDRGSQRGEIVEENATEHDRTRQNATGADLLSTGAAICCPIGGAHQS